MDSLLATLAKGGDTDANCAVVMGLVGSVIGYNAIPSYFKQKVVNSRMSQSSRPRNDEYTPYHIIEIVEKLMKNRPEHYVKESSTAPNSILVWTDWFLTMILYYLCYGIFNSDNISNQINNMQRGRSGSRSGLADRVLNIGELIEKAGDKNLYQFKMIFHFMMVFLFSSFIQMGFPIIFQPAVIICADGQVCTE